MIFCYTLEVCLVIWMQYKSVCENLNCDLNWNLAMKFNSSWFFFVWLLSFKMSTLKSPIMMIGQCSGECWIKVWKLFRNVKNEHEWASYTHTICIIFHVLILKVGIICSEPSLVIVLSSTTSLLHEKGGQKVGKVPHVHPLFHFQEGIEPKAFPMFMHCSICPIHHLCHVLDPPTTFHGFIHCPIFSPTSSNWFFTIKFISKVGPTCPRVHSLSNYLRSFTTLFCKEFGSTSMSSSIVWLLLSYFSVLLKNILDNFTHH